MLYMEFSLLPKCFVLVKSKTQHDERPEPHEVRHDNTRCDTNVRSTIITTPEHLVPTWWKNFSSGFPIEKAMMCEWKWFSFVTAAEVWKNTLLFWRHQLYSVRLSHPCLFKLRSLVNNLVPGGFTSSLCDQCDEKVVEMLRYYYGSNNKRSDFERSRSIEVFDQKCQSYYWKLGYLNDENPKFIYLFLMMLVSF